MCLPVDARRVDYPVFLEWEGEMSEHIREIRRRACNGIAELRERIQGEGCEDECTLMSGDIDELAAVIDLIDHWAGVC